MTEPLAGLRVVVTRSASQASELSERLSDLGAEPIEVATIQIVEPTDGGAALSTAIEQLSRFVWVVLASPNGARAFVAAVGARVGLLPRIACVGPSTARVLTDAGYKVELIPDRYVAEGLVDAMPSAGADQGELLLVQAETTRPILEAGLSDRGWQVRRVVAYRTIDAEVLPIDREAVAGADVVTFTSSSTVERFVRILGAEAIPPAVVCIGPITSATAREHGVAVTIEATEHNLDGLVDALVSWASAKRGESG